MRQTKIVCTLGPASSGLENLCRMIEAGMDVARLNFSHGDQDSHRRSYQEVREASRRTGKPVGILADISGPKIRLRDVPNGAATIEAGGKLVLAGEHCTGTSERVGVTYDGLAKVVEVGDPIFIDDGLLELTVEAVKGDDVHCRVKEGGVLRSRKGVNLPRVALAMPAITPKDEKDIAFGRELGIDFFALSFVRHPSDVQQAKALAGEIPVIAKIEKPKAIEHLDAVADVADGCMVARGDLGIEAGAEKVPMLQKRIIRAMNRRAKPVITATQMLESMVSNPRPTRAEVSDVANAVLDGTDAVMLSAESAVGKYPVRAVATMARVIEQVESDCRHAGIVGPSSQIGPPTLRNAIAQAAAQSAVNQEVKAVVVYTDLGHGPALVSARRPYSVILALSEDETVLTRMSLLWGVRPIRTHRLEGIDNAVHEAERIVCEQGLARSGDNIAVAFTLEREEGFRGPSALCLWTVRGSV